MAGRIGAVVRGLGLGERSLAGFAAAGCGHIARGCEAKLAGVHGPLPSSQVSLLKG